MPANLFVGNDIVSWNSPEAEVQINNTRFIHRVFTLQEQMLMNRVFLSQSQFLWLLWTGKETAFKILSKHYPELVFSHKKFQVSFSAFLGLPLTGCVYHPLGSVNLQWTWNKEYIHCLGLERIELQDAPWQKIISSVQIRTVKENNTDSSDFDQEEQASFSTQASAEVRRLAKNLLARIGWEQVKIKRMKLGPGRWGPPFAEQKGKVIPVDLSLSHDQNHVAAACLPAPEQSTLQRL